MRQNIPQWRGGILGGIGARDGVFWITMFVFLVGLGGQLSILFNENSLNMMDKTAWSFGQIVAVTIWLPPIVDYLISSVRKCKFNLKKFKLYQQTHHLRRRND